MIKIEKLDAAKAVFTRNGVEHMVFLNALLTRDEYATLRVTQGSVVVSIDEQEIVTISAQQPAPAPAPQPVAEAEPPKSPEQAEPAVETPVEAPVKTIVQPKPRAAAK